MTFSYSVRSRSNLKGLHPDLLRVAERAIKITSVDFVITEGMRTVTRQKELFKAGATRTMNSRHLTGHALDVAAWVAGGVRWDWPLYAKIAAAFKQAALELDVPIIWGGDWKSFRDGPHFELDRRKYP